MGTEYKELGKKVTTTWVNSLTVIEEWSSKSKQVLRASPTGESEMLLYVFIGAEEGIVDLTVDVGLLELLREAT